MRVVLPALSLCASCERLSLFGLYRASHRCCVLRSVPYVLSVHAGPRVRVYQDPHLRRQTHLPLQAEGATPDGHRRKQSERWDVHISPTQRFVPCRNEVTETVVST